MHHSQPPISPWQNLARWLHRFEDALLVLVLLSMLLLACTQILLRNGFDGGLSWADSLVRVLVLWMGLIGAMIAVRSTGHISIDLLPRMIGLRARQWMVALTSLCTAAICGYLAYQGYRFVGFEKEDGIIAFGQVPNWWCALIIPLAFGVMALRYVLETVALLRGKIDPVAN